MNGAAPPPAPRAGPPMLGWNRLLVASYQCVLVGLIISVEFPTTSAVEVIAREIPVGLATLLAFGIFERWPARLPGWLARWVLQVAAVAFVIPFTVFAVYSAITYGDATPWWQVPSRVSGYFTITMTALLVAPWTAVAALFRQRDTAARRQALAFQLERSELERQALDARLRLLQAQVEPHFLFNTLANVRELVDSGSPQASKVLASLIAYLRAAVPRLHETRSTIDRELELVRAYLELMHMRMPDRLQYGFEVEAAALPLACPPTTLLTLVENAVRHGIDPSEEGGRIDVRVELRDGRCRAQVRDTGVGLRAQGQGLGTGLAALLERLKLSLGEDARLDLRPLAPRGMSAELDFPARASS